MRRTDLWVALAGGALGAVGSLPWPVAWDTQILTGALLGASLGLARPAPRAAWLSAAAVFVAAGFLGELPGGAESVVAYVLVAGHGFAAGRFDGRVSGIAGVVTLVGTSVTCSLMTGAVEVVFLFILPAAWGAGRALRERSLVAEQLQVRARELEAEREAFAALSVRNERARIASELHDIVAHAISVMVVQAGAGRRLAGRDPAATAEVFEVIADAARQAEHEMGLLVELLAAESAPAPDLAVVEELVSRAVGSGLDVRLALEGEREGLPAAVTMLAYRVVQEALTNAVRYAAGAPVAVRLRGAAGVLDVDVSNGPASDEAALAGTGSGSGLQGLRERIEAVGGSLAAGPDDAGGWRVFARLPAAAAAGST